MRKGHIVTALILGAIVAVFVASYYSRVTNGQHGDKATWIKKHPQTINNNGNPKGFCLKCHEKRGETVDNFCNKCHQEMGVKKIDINKLQKRG